MKTGQLRAVEHLREAEKALTEAAKLMASSGQRGRAFGLTVRALAHVTSALAALSPPETTDARETE